MANVLRHDRCPHCGSDQFYVRVRVKGIVHEHHRFSDGSTGDNHDMWQGLDYTPFKKAYCSGCDAPLGTWEDSDALD